MGPKNRPGGFTEIDVAIVKGDHDGTPRERTSRAKVLLHIHGCHRVGAIAASER